MFTFTFLIFSFLLHSCFTFIRGYTLGTRGSFTVTVLLGLIQLMSLAYLGHNLLANGDITTMRLTYGSWFEIGSIHAS